MLVVGRELFRRGWRVRMLTGARYAERVRAAGVEFVALPPEADTLDAVGSDGRNRGIAVINDGVEEAFVRPALPAARRLEELRAAEPADVVFHDMTFLGVQTLFARPRAERPLTVMCGVGPAGFSSRDCPPYGLGIVPARSRSLGRIRDAVLNRSARWVLSGAHKALDGMLSELGAPGLHGAFFMDVLTRSDLLAQFSVAEFEYPRSDAPDSLRFYGPMTPPSAPTGEVPAWRQTLDDSIPVVHVTQGTVANTDFSELIEPTLQALASHPVQVVVTGGGRSASALPPLPGNALAADYLPYDVLLPRTDVFITNGGYGGLHHAMRYGVPIVVAGDSEDKVETSARAQWSGAGISLRTGRPSADQVGRAVTKILDDPRYAAASRRIGESIARAGGAPALVDDVEAMLAR
jgi:MGT family glycosyltransferase